MKSIFYEVYFLWSLFFYGVYFFMESIFLELWEPSLMYCRKTMESPVIALKLAIQTTNHNIGRIEQKHRVCFGAFMGKPEMSDNPRNE